MAHPLSSGMNASWTWALRDRGWSAEAMRGVYERKESLTLSVWVYVSAWRAGGSTRVDLERGSGNSCSAQAVTCMSVCEGSAATSLDVLCHRRS
jgi:hypothetical protein